MALDFKVTVVCGNPEKDVDAKFQNFGEAIIFFTEKARYIMDFNVNCTVELKNTVTNVVISKAQRVQI